MLGNVGIKLALKVASLDPEKKDLKKVIEASEDLDFRVIINELQNHEPFDLCKFCKLSDEQKFFTEIFIKNRGNIKEIEKELKISYPTVRNKLEDVIKALGYKTEQKSKVDKKEILQQLSDGKISKEEALKKLSE